MDGYVLQLIPDDETQPTVYLTENGGTLEDLDRANLFSDLSSARLQAGQIQSQYTSYSVQALPASKGIILKSHVATSSINQSSATV